MQGRFIPACGRPWARLSDYFGGKDALFRHVLCEQMTSAFAAAPVPSSGPEDVAEYAGKLFDYMHANPRFVRLLQWEALTVPDEQQRTASYATRTAALSAGQASGAVDDAIDADLLNVLILGIAGYWTVLPQVERMITAASGITEDAERARRRAAVVEAARRIATPRPD